MSRFFTFLAGKKRFLFVGRGVLAALFCLGIWVGTAAPAQAQLTKKTLQYGGTRTWYEHVPASYDGSHAVPLVLVLHGVQSTGDKFEPQSEWTPVSDQQGFIVVYPNGGLDFGSAGLGWNDFMYQGEAPDDVGFLFTLIQTLKATYNVNADRVYMTGFSNGASMSNTFSGVHASVLAAMAPASSDWMTTYGIPESAQHPDGTVSSWISRGALENFQEGNQSHDVQDANQTAYWVGIDGCNPTPQNVVDGIYSTAIYTGGQGEVRYSKVAGYDHQYGPGFAVKIWNDFFSRIVRNTVAPPTMPPVITSPKTGDATTGTAFSYQITADNTATSYGASALPPGLSIDPASGLISGTPTVAGTYAVTLQATNAGGTGAADLTLSVAAAVPPVITSATTADAATGVPFNYQITTDSAVANYDANPLPPGLGIDPASGVISGTPTVAGTYVLGLQATNVGGTGVVNLTLTVTASFTPPTFFAGEKPLGSGAYYLEFPGGSPFGYYAYLDDPHYIYHFDLGYEYVFDAADGQDGVYLYDFTTGDFFYTSPVFPFPYLFEFTLNSVVYYYPDPADPEHYNSNGVRYFYVFNSGEVISE